jgi:hypothetical protein
MEVTFTITRNHDPPRSVVAKGTHPLAHWWEPWSKDPKHRCEPVPWLELGALGLENGALIMV